MAWWKKADLLLERNPPANDLPKCNGREMLPERAEDDGHDSSRMPRESFLLILLRALSSWSV
jgi:hypothetical protein